MDTLTHVLSGALTGRCLSNKAKKSSVKAFILVGALAALFPDLDIVLKFISDELYLLNHRGFTHSFIFIPIFAIFISWFCAFIFKTKILFRKDWIDETATYLELFKEFYPVVLIGMIIHVCGDIITSFGTMFLHPISNTRFESGSVFIIDLIFTGIIIAGLLFSWKEKDPNKKILKARIFMGALLIYVAFTQILKIHAENNIHKNYQKVHIQADKFEWKSVPQMLTPFKWLVMGLDKKNKDYYLVEMNLLEGKDNWKITKHPIYGIENPERAKKLLEDIAYKDYVWFLTDPVYHSQNNECVFFQKAQNISKMRNPFIYGFCEKDGNKYTIRKK